MTLTIKLKQKERKQCTKIVTIQSVTRVNPQAIGKQIIG